MITLLNFWERNVEEFETKLNSLELIGQVALGQAQTRIHIDLQQPGFGEVVTIDPEHWPHLPNYLSVDVHLMVNSPEPWLDRVVRPQTKTVICQIEKITDLSTWGSLCRERNVIAGVCIDYPTQVESVRNDLITFVNEYPDSQILVMGYDAGILNQHFHDDVYEKIKAVRESAGDNAEIIIDGGVNFDVAQKCREAGADGVAALSYIWNNFPDNYYQLMQIP